MENVGYWKPNLESQQCDIVAALGKVGVIEPGESLGLIHRRWESGDGVELWPQGLDPTRAVYMGEGREAVCAQSPATACCRDVSSVEVLMNYHQGLKTELEARVPELTACQELGRSLLLNKSAMADEVGRGAGGSPLLSVSTGVGATLTPLPPTHHSQIQAQLDKLGTRKEEVSDKWDRHWEWLQQSEWGPDAHGSRARDLLQCV